MIIKQIVLFFWASNLLSVPVSLSRFFDLSRWVFIFTMTIGHKRIKKTSDSTILLRTFYSILEAQKVTQVTQCLVLLPWIPSDGVWDKTGAKVLPVGSSDYPVKKMIAIGSMIWCAVQNTIKIIDSTLLELHVRWWHASLNVEYSVISKYSFC